MHDQESCPLCGGNNCPVIHNFVLEDIYPFPERGLQKTNDYSRNYILFEKVLKRAVSEVRVEFRLCNRCGFIFFSPRPDQSDLSVKYEMIKQNKETEEREKVYSLVDLRRLRAKEIFRIVGPYIQRKSGRVLDVGGSDGHCLAYFTDEFLCGVLDYENRDITPGVRKLGETFEDLKETDVFDVILTCHTLEHIPDICSFIKGVRSHLEEEGVVYIEVPYGCSNEIYKTSNLLTHINFFSEGSLGFLLNKAGLSVQYIASKPVLSSKRYLPVIIAIARKANECPIVERYWKEGFSITKHQMSKSLDVDVFLRNLWLVASNPIQYCGKFAKLVVGLIRKKSFL